RRRPRRSAGNSVHRRDCSLRISDTVSQAQTVAFHDRTHKRRSRTFRWNLNDIRPRASPFFIAPPMAVCYLLRIHFPPEHIKRAMPTDDLREDASRYLMHTYAPLPISIVRGKGSRVYDLEG